ncbi:hypothetical protein IQ07DRAFT_369354 [Pyrenochaeta sp. DS3sAY3a]|nr:hypothetical protein IQ07DRAFT_369354 [Pyrenochaeta sp. DS3sAY3a]
MNSPNTLQSQPFSRPGRKPKHAGDVEEPGKKPKKVNSEIRKQQNRIASRNYREKRKRKLQYLQQLIKDSPNDQQESEPSPEQHDAYARSISADYEVSGPSSSPYLLPSHSDFASMSSTSATVSDPILAASAASFDSHLLATSQAYSGYETTWNAPIYSPPPPVNMSTWNIPPWMPSIDYSPRVAPRPEAYQYSPPATQPVFEQTHTPLRQPRELLSNTDMFAFGSYASQSQTSGMPNMPFGQQTYGFERSVYI